jgi:hypothetical protein
VLLPEIVFSTPSSTSSTGEHQIRARSSRAGETRDNRETYELLGISQKLNGGALWRIHSIQQEIPRKTLQLWVTP